MDNVISITKATKTIKGKKVLDSIDLSIGYGIYGLVGENGSGKSMLLKLISGLIMATSGEVKVLDKTVGTGGRLADNTGIMIEYPGLMNQMSAIDNLRVLAKISENPDEKYLIELIEMVGLYPGDKRHVKKYSVGMRQKLGIAIALLDHPKLVLLDEPTNNLDEKSTQNIHQILTDYKKNGSTIIIASHDKNEVKTLCKEIITIENGRIGEVAK